MVGAFRGSLKGFLCLGIWWAVATQGWSQVTTATFYGIVTDSSGAVVPGAQITFRHEATGATSSKVTDTGGEFLFEFLRVGLYTLTIQAQGFKRIESSGIELGASQRVRQTFTLEVGTVAETVEVTGQTPLVNTVRTHSMAACSRRFGPRI